MTLSDYSANTIEAALKAVPYIGETLCQFIFGPSAERRMKRIEATLAEVAEILRARGTAPIVATEEFVNLLEVTVPRIARATNEEVRHRFRDLLLNAAQLDTGDPAWNNVNLVASMLDSIEAPGLAIVAALARCPESAGVKFSKDPVPNVQLVSQPQPQLIVGDFDYDHPITGLSPIPYDWEPLKEWAYRLKDLRLIHFHTSSAKGGFGNVYLSTLGQFLVKWSLDDVSNADRAK